jgi:hypothetical protein
MISAPAYQKAVSINLFGAALTWLKTLGAASMGRRATAIDRTTKSYQGYMRVGGENSIWRNAARRWGARISRSRGSAPCTVTSQGNTMSLLKSAANGRTWGIEISYGEVGAGAAKMPRTGIGQAVMLVHDSVDQAFLAT